MTHLGDNLDYSAQLSALIDREVEKRRHILIKILDECCDFYRRKYEKVLCDVLATKAAENVNFSIDVLPKVAPIAEKKVAAQLRSAMRLESEFREMQAENSEAPNLQPSSQQFPSDIFTGNAPSFSNKTGPRTSPSGAVPKSRVNLRAQPRPLIAHVENVNMEVDHSVQFGKNDVNMDTRFISKL